MNERLRTTLRAWPVITAATIGLCFLTQSGAKLFGIDLPDQQNVEVVRQWVLHSLDSLKCFMMCAFLLLQVVVLLPIIEEIIFRWVLVRLPIRIATKKRQSEPPPALGWTLAVVSSALFSAAHYIDQPFPDAAFIALFFFGLAQCWLYAKTNRLWCPMMNHMLFNMTNLVLMFIVPQ
ncbi:MAG: CPBP family intramembrane metalloprotease [Kiritimatiellae bacterium]|nr:CPBP family intramembrane metalloprotease [Kiritimatiellia bacterium]